MGSYRRIREEAYEANMEVSAKRLAIYTFGNVSALDAEQGVFAIKPSGVPYPDLTPEKMVIVSVEGEVMEGDLRPSSDTPTHAFLYRHFEGIGGITHTHSPFAVAWSQAQLPIPIFGTTHADHLTVDIPCTAVMTDEAIERDYEVETGRQITEAMAGMNPHEIEMILVASHGPFAWGRDAARSVYNAVVLEELAKIAYYTTTLNPEPAPLKQTLRDKHYLRKHGANAYYGQGGTR
ncbi:MAG: L-ribulose-5-phosphate 4-epimerase AraD [Spirochaetota bacterium]